MTIIDNGTINYRDEVIRKLIHLCSLSIPIVYYFISRHDALLILSVLTFVVIVIDLLRYFSPAIAKIFYSIFGFLLRKHEKDNNKKALNGASYVLLSATICVFLFPKILFLTAFGVLIISDSMAALVGRKFGKHKLLRKSLEGTLAFFISAIIVVLISPKITGDIYEYLIGFFAAGTAAIVENISYGWMDDNLSVPVTIGFIMWALYIIVLPDIILIIPNVPR
ncbi:MAG: dolichol kinase [Bacteroidetes bacterium]|nr:dolichol kinase [Bacteroidota bacterium]MCH8169563.1 dolichol kinase [Bacteroidota bacterium]MCH8941224.1 dolichol kinase [Bacteroidota bacterium]